MISHSDTVGLIINVIGNSKANFFLYVSPYTTPKEMYDLVKDKTGFGSVRLISGVPLGYFLRMTRLMMRFFLSKM